MLTKITCTYKSRAMRKGKRIRSYRTVPYRFTAIEGISGEMGRRRTVNPISFVVEKFDTKRLWKSIYGYIGKAYDTEYWKESAFMRTAVAVSRTDWKRTPRQRVLLKGNISRGT